MKRPPLTKEQEDLLYDLYYKRKMIFGRDKIFHLREVQLAGITRRQVSDWLSKQMVHQMFMPARKPRDVQPTVAKRPFGQVGIDLIDMTTMADSGYKWLLTGVDFFTKKGYAVPMKDKTEKAVIAAFRRLVQQMTEPPGSIRSDNGSEFIAEGFKRLLEEMAIKQVLSSAGKPQSNGQIERFNGILKRLIKMNYASSGKNDWVSELPVYLDGYNSTYQRVIKMSPNEAESTMLDPDDGGETKEIIHDFIRKNVTDRHPIDRQKFEPGDTVRVRLEQQPNQKRAEAWSRDTYLVIAALKPREEHRSWQYELLDVPGRFYNNDLQLIKEVQNEISLPRTYIVSKIVRPAVHGNVPGYIVRWKGFKAADDTFEPREALMIDVPKEVEQYDREHNVRWTQSRGKWRFTTS